MTSHKQYRNLLESIIQRAKDASDCLIVDDLSNFQTAVTDVESDINSLLAMVNKDEAILAVLEAEAEEIARMP